MKHSDAEPLAERGGISGPASDRGAVAVIVAILIPLFLILCGISIDVGRWYVEGQRAQNAADAAAMAGVTWLPQDPTNAFAKARMVAKVNGYPDPDTVEAFVAEDASTQLYVTVSSTITNIFGGLFGNPTTTLSRTALADYAAPAIMGSPCNALGNQPPSTAAGAKPVGTVIPGVDVGSSPPGPGYPACQITPAFWMNIAGPATGKVSGDRYATLSNCTGADGCTTDGTNINTEHDKNGYIFVVRVQPTAVRQPITLQLYDPVFAYTGDTCTAFPKIMTVTKKALNSNVATLTTSGNHGYAVGDYITVVDIGSPFDGTYVLTAVPNPTSFSYAKVNANIATTTLTSVGSSFEVIGVTKKALTSDVAMLTTTTVDGLVVGDFVTVSGVGAPFDGSFAVTAVKTTTPYTFSYAKVNANITTTNLATRGIAVETMANDYSTTAEAAARYSGNSDSNVNAKTFCTGDQRLNSGNHLNTSVVLREQTDSLNPFDSTKSPPIAGCSKQYGSLRTGAPNDSGTLVEPTASQLTKGSATYDPSLAQVFHQWVNFCTFTPERTGDYYLQVRTNVDIVGARNGNNYIYDVSSGLQLTDPASGDIDPDGSGHNRFAIRAALSTDESPPALGAQVSVSGWQHMSIYTNAAGASSTFNLVQVLPNSAGNSFNFAAYDNGDASCPNPGDCTLQVSMPFDARPKDGGTLNFGDCVGTGPESTPIQNTNCTFNVSGNNGKIQIITVPIPTNYTCDDQSPGGCWFRVTARFPAAVNDTVTYGAEIIEDPVRLIQ